jgi:hypothetical protein
MKLAITPELWFSAFILTQAVEAPIYVWASRGGQWRWRRRLAVALGASALTHPVVWWVIPRLEWSSYRAYFIAAEGFALVVEALLLVLALKKRIAAALAWSLLANGASVAVGRLLRELFGWP